MVRVIVNADDLAFDGGVDDGIFDLAGRGVVTSASAMVLAPRWPATAKRFNSATLDLGLHLDFTSAFAQLKGLPHSLGKLLIAANAGALASGVLDQAIRLQLHRFEDAAGAPPVFVDGHQHVHHFPVIRDALVRVLGNRYGAGTQAVAVRNCRPRRWRGPKAAFIGMTGALRLGHLADAKGWLQNSDFAGVYNFAENAALVLLWKGWLSGLEGSLPLVMCHPAAGQRRAGSQDPIAKARRREFAWLSSPEFFRLLASLRREPARWIQAETVAPITVGPRL